MSLAICNGASLRSLASTSLNERLERAMSRSIWLVSILAIVTFCCSSCTKSVIETPPTSASGDRTTFNAIYADATSKFSKLYSDISSITAKAKSRGAPESVKTEYSVVRQRYNAYLTYYSGCIQASICVTSTLQEHENLVAASYDAYVKEVNRVTLTAGQDPLTAAAVIAALKELTPIAKDVYSWIKEQRKAHTDSEKADQSKLIENLRSDWQLKDWNDV